MSIAYIVYKKHKITKDFEILGCALSVNAANTLLEEFKRETSCFEISRLQWHLLKDRANNVEKYIGYEITAEDYCNVIYKYVTDEYPIHLLLKAYNAYEIESNFEYVIEETDVYE